MSVGTGLLQYAFLPTLSETLAPESSAFIMAAFAGVFSALACAEPRKALFFGLITVLIFTGVVVFVPGDQPPSLMYRFEFFLGLATFLPGLRKLFFREFAPLVEAH
jgi:hypothetical protein